jgi:O-antigen/teichoic acid export membrane protein
VTHPLAAGEPDRDILDTPQAGPAAIRGSALRTTGYVVGVLLSALSAPLLIRHLGIADFGRYVTVLALIAIVGGLADAGLTAVGVREYTVRPVEARARLMQSLLGLRLVLTTLAVGAAVAFSALAGYGSALVLGTLLAGIGLIAQVTQNTLSIPLQTDLRLGWVTGAELLKQVLSVVLIVAGVIAGAGVVEFLAVPIPAGLAAIALVAMLVRASVPLRAAFQPEDWAGLLRDSVVFAAATAISVAYLRVTVVLMSLIATEIQTGYFATSFRVLEVLMGVPAILISTLFPVLARAGRDDLRRLGAAVQRILDVAFILGVGAGLAICLAAAPLVLVLGGEAADPAGPVLRIQAPGIVATFIATTCQFALLSMRQHKTILLANVVAITTSVALTFVLVPVWDARGAAVATTAAEWLLALTAFVALRRALPEAHVGIGVAPKVVLAAALGILPLLMLPPVAATVVGLAIFAGVLLALRAVPPELAVLVRRGP